MVKCFCDPATLNYSVQCPQFGKSFKQTCRSKHVLKSRALWLPVQYLIPAQGSLDWTSCNLIEDSGL